jgi:hypothetical protein
VAEERVASRTSGAPPAGTDERPEAVRRTVGQTADEPAQQTGQPTAEKSAQRPAQKPAQKPAQPAGPAGRRMRARLARMATKTQTSENPVLEPLFRAVRANHAKADLELLERAYLTAERLHAG